MGKLLETARAVKIERAENDISDPIARQDVHPACAPSGQEAAPQERPWNDWEECLNTALTWAQSRAVGGSSETIKHVSAELVHIACWMCKD